MASVKFLMPTYRGVLTFVGAACIAYLCSYVSLVVSASYPGLRFLGRYVFVAGFLCIVLLSFERGFKLRKLPGYLPIFAFTIYYLIHCIYFENGRFETHGQSVFLVYFLAISFWLLIRTEADYLQMLLIIWIFLLVVLSYYIQLVADFGPVVSRITPEDMGLAVNGNVLCLMSTTFSILSLRIYETYLPGRVKRSVNRQRLEALGLSSISLACLTFTFWHLNMTFTMVNLIILGFIMHRYSSKSVKVGLLLLVFAVAVASIDFSYFDAPLVDQFNLYSERVESGGSANHRLVSAIDVYNKWLMNPIFGAPQHLVVQPVWGSSNHLFYLNILAIYGVVGFILFGTLILSLILPGVRSMSSGQMLARVLFLTIWMVGPSTYPQAICLLIMLPREFYSNSNSRFRTGVKSVPLDQS